MFAVPPLRGTPTTVKPVMSAGQEEAGGGA